MAGDWEEYVMVLVREWVYEVQGPTGLGIGYSVGATEKPVTRT
jgi:hypothetical protein